MVVIKPHLIATRDRLLNHAEHQQFVLGCDQATILELVENSHLVMVCKNGM